MKKVFLKETHLFSVSKQGNLEYTKTIESAVFMSKNRYFDCLKVQLEPLGYVLEQQFFTKNILSNHSWNRITLFFS
jgi:hypothetical protein